MGHVKHCNCIKFMFVAHAKHAFNNVKGWKHEAKATNTTIKIQTIVIINKKIGLGPATKKGSLCHVTFKVNR